jgi:peptidyl-prolyl cis-trans isomerase A (cyclophilin A)
MRTLALMLLLAAPAFADATVGEHGMADPVAGKFTLDEAVKGVKGTGVLMAKIDVQQGGKDLGAFACELFEKETPKTVANFVGLARGLRPAKDPKTGQWEKKPFYDGLTFHRVIPGFMIQGGDPTGTGRGNPGYQFEDEIVADLKMDKGGILAMANAGPGTNGSQFFITEKAATWLTGHHTIFGQCTPVDLVTKIAGVPKTQPGPNASIPATPVTIGKVLISRQPKKPGK